MALFLFSNLMTQQSWTEDYASVEEYQVRPRFPIQSLPSPVKSWVLDDSGNVAVLCQ